MYAVQDASLREGRHRTSKAMLNNAKNVQEAGERYRQSIPDLIKRVKEEKEGDIQEVLRKVAESIREPWEWMVERRPKGRSPHWNVKLQFM